jgi:release factor glutamine methyltransferase
MKKSDIINLWKDLELKNSDIEKIILKETWLSKSQLFITDEIDDKYKETLNKKFKVLKAWYPLEYIIEKADFYSEEFYVNSNVLVPRNDTEIMVDKAIEEALAFKSVTLIDVWTWTSCIPISIIKNSSRVENCYVIDISESALEVSLKNINNHKLDKKIKQINSNLLNKIIWSNDYRLNKNLIITANLPYIKSWDYENMDVETYKFEPSLALYGWDETWFELYEELIDEVFKLKKLNYISHLILFIEIWFDQKDYSNKYLSELNLKFNYFKDNSWIDRCIRIEF